MTDQPVIATRTLKVEGRKRPAVVTFHAPRQTGDEEWACAWRVTGMRKARDAYGVDAVQALSLALQAVRQHLDDSSLRYTWLGLDSGNHGIEQTIFTCYGMDFARRMARMIERETTRYVRRHVLVRRQRRDR